MEGVQTVDVSWLHHSQKDHLSRTKSVSASDKPGTESEPTTSQSKSQRRSRSNSNPARPTPPPSTSEPKQAPHNDAAPVQAKPPPVEKHEEQKPSTPSPASRKTDPKPIGRRNSWISTLSSKFSSGTTPPSQASLKASPASPKTTSPLELHNPFGAAFSPKDKEEEKKDESNPFTSSSPKGPSFIHNALRKFSSNSGGLPKLHPNGSICPRRVMNIDEKRHRCKIADLNQAKLNRVAFCVDVEIAGISHRDDDEDAPPTNQLRHPQPESNKAKKADLKPKEQDEAGALNNPEATLVAKDSASSAPVAVPAPTTGDVKAESSSPPTNTDSSKPSTNPTPSGEGADPTRKQEKKKRSEAERKERKERKRRQAVANGSIPLQLDAENDEEYSHGPAPASSVPRSKTQSHPTTDPVRIYRRCCQLRETPVLKRVVDEISKPSSTLAESPGTVAALDLSNFPMTSQDLTTFSDWLAVVPVRKLILENCALTDTSVRAILSALLSTKTVEQMRYRRRRSRRPDSPDSLDHERYGVVEKLSLKDNLKIGREGWRHISLFIHLSKSLKAIDLSGIPLPQVQVAIDGSGTTCQPHAPMADVSMVFASALAERFAGNYLEELLMSECYPSVDAVKQICHASAKMGLRRLGFASNGLTREGLEHVAEYLKAGQCEGLDLGGNAITDDLDLITDAIEPELPLYALSLADCSLNGSVIYPLLQSLAQIHNLRFIDFSHNRELFSSQANTLGAFRRFLPKMTSLKRVHLANVNLSSDHVIGLAEVLPECPSLCHLNILENQQIVDLASTIDPVAQEEACAVYASMMAAVRVSRTIIAVDIEVPSAENNEVIKALGSQIVAYSLRNLEGGAIAEELSGSLSPLEIPIPDVLQHLVGHGHSAISEEPYDDEDEAAPDEDYVIGGTGVVKALGVCLGNLDQHGLDVLGDQSLPPSGTTTPRRRKSRGVPTKRPRDMSKNLLESARNIRTRIQSALIREDRAGNDTNYRRLQFLDMTLHKMIQRFEDEYPETRIVPQLPPATPVPDTISQHSGDDDGSGSFAAGGNMNNSQLDETGGDEEDTDQYAVRLSRTSSMTSLHSRAMTSQEGHVHRIGQNLRRDFLKPSLVPSDGDEDFDYEDDTSHIAALRQKLDLLHEQQSLSQFEGFDADMAFNHLGTTVDDLYHSQQQDAEGFERFKQSQIAAQINSGIRSRDIIEPRTGSDEPESKSPS